MINGLDIYYSKKERTHGKDLAPISKKPQSGKGLKPISNKGKGCEKVGKGLKLLQ